MDQVQISLRKRGTGEEIGMNGGNSVADGGLNRSLAEIRAAFELYYPHLPIRHALLRLLVNTIRSVHNQANGPWRWTVTSPCPEADGADYECSGGDIRGPWHPWAPDDADLQAIEYRYTLPPLS